MSQTVITEAFEQWKAQQATNNQAVVLDEFVLANVPGLDPSKPIDRKEGMPPTVQIVHRQAVSKTGLVNDNAVVYSVTIGADVGDFAFNWIGLINKATGTVAMIVHAPEQSKVKNASGQQGNVLTRSFLMEYSGAVSQTLISTPAASWQIDFTARLAGMDEALRLANLDSYGIGAFFDAGFLVAKTGSQHFVTKGLAYIGGLRASLDDNTNITVATKPTKVWADVSYSGTLTSAYQTGIKFTVAPMLANYTTNGVAHYVFALASIDAAGAITDLRPKGSLSDQQGGNDFVRKDKNLSDISDPVVALTALNGVAATRTINKRPLSGDVVLNSADVGALPSGGTAVAATKLDAARKIAGVAFDGTSDISITAANVGALPSGGTAVAATKLATARKIAGVAFDGTADINITAADAGALPIAGGTVTGNFAVNGSTTLRGDVNLNSTAFVYKRGNQQTSSTYAHTQGFRLIGRSDSLFADVYHGEQIGTYHALSVHVAGGGADGWYEFRNNGNFAIAGSDPKLIVGNAQYFQDGNVAGSLWNGRLSDWLNNNNNNLKTDAQARADGAQNNAVHWAGNDLRNDIYNWVKANFVTRVARGAQASMTMDGALVEAPAGCVLTGGNGNEGNQIGVALYRPLQVFRNGGWVTIEG